MKHTFLKRFPQALLVPLILTFASGTASSLQAKQYDPHIMYVFPPGGQQGTTFEAMIRGRGLEGAGQVRVSGQGVTASVVAIEEPDTKLQQRSKNRQDMSENPNIVPVSVTIAKDAAVGIRDLRLMTPKGPSNRFFFAVGQLAEVNEVEPNEQAGQVQTLDALPVLVNGQVFQGDRDVFRFTAKAGQMLVCEVQGQKLLPYIPDAVPGWLQASLTLYDATGKELKHVDDFRFRPDPVLFYKVETDGQYLIEIKDVLFRGREDLVYRLSIGALPFITHVYPLGGRRESEVQVELHGVNLPSASTSLALAGDAPPVRLVQVTNHTLMSNALPFAAGSLPEAHETEPNDIIEQAQKVSAPVTINGRMQADGDSDCFVFSAQAKDKLVMDVHARRLESPLDSIITLFNSQGRQLVENDDTVDPSAGLITHHADSYLSYTLPADGDYVLRLRDVQDRGGQEFAYRLTIAPPRQDFALRVVPAHLRVGKGATTVAKVKAYRLDRFDPEIELQVEGLPPGFVVSPAVIGKGQPDGRLTITAPPDAPPAILSPTVRGTASSGETTLERQAMPAEELMQAFYYWHDVPTDEFLLAVVEPPALTLATEAPDTEVREIPRGGTAQVKVKLTRTDKVKGAVRITADGLAKGITVKATNIPLDQQEATVTINVLKQAAVGLRENVVLTGTLRAGKDTMTSVAPAIPIRVIAEKQQK